MRVRNIYMNKCFLVTFLLCVISHYSLPAQPDSLLISHKIDSLKSLVAASVDPHVTIPLLTSLADLTNQTPAEIGWLERCYEEACRIDSIPAVYFALLNLSRHYYNEYGQRDSILYWGRKVDSISKSRNEYPNALFDVKSYSCQDLLWSGEYEQALNEALNEYRLASDIKHLYGLVRCTESLGLIYRRMNRCNDAVDVFQEGLEMLENMDCTEAKRTETRMRMTAYQAECASREIPFERAIGIFERYEAAVDSMAAMTSRMETFVNVKREYWLLYSLFADLYIRENMLAEARRMLAKAGKYAGNIVVEGDYAENTYLATLAHYYRKTGNTTRALQLMDEIFKTERIPGDLQFKADILEEQGRLAEALVLYDELNDISLQQNKETFFRQVNQLRALHELRNKEAQEHEMQLNNERMAEKQHLIIFLSAVFLVLLYLSYVLFCYYQRARRLKNELLLEKHSLLESENSLKSEKVKAEEASRMKSTFIANMSHEIRTPLNAIVGFSDLLSDTSGFTEEEVKLFIETINKNCGLLLALINDILDLSRIESGTMDFQFAGHNLPLLMKNVYDSQRLNMPPGVQLVLKLPENSKKYLVTDNVRLQQVVNNLINNAVKFTTQGSITFGYTEEEPGYTSLFVEDTGKGISEDGLRHIFERFYKVDSFTQGAGLGLSICQTIVGRLNGTITVASEEGHGTRFTVRLPDICE